MLVEVTLFAYQVRQYVSGEILVISPIALGTFRTARSTARNTYGSPTMWLFSLDVLESWGAKVERDGDNRSMQIISHRASSSYGFEHVVGKNASAI